MSRIQTILEKAEREGTVRRMHVVADGAPAGATAVGEPALAAEAVAFATPPPDLPIETPAPAVLTGAAPPAPPTRIVSGARLDPTLVIASSSGHVAAEQYRALRTRLLHADTGTSMNVVLVTSPGRGDGKSLTVANLGLTMAQEPQRRICVVDADLRQPNQDRLFGVPPAPGLADVLAGDAALDEALVTIEEYDITVLPAGTASAHPAELLGTIDMRRTIETLRARFDCVVIDAPAALPLADVGILAPLVDSVVMVVRAGMTGRPAIHDAIASIDGGKLLGIVLNEAQ
jgi:capsular exopolysaccharide synthesis family protein